MADRGNEVTMRRRIVVGLTGSSGARFTLAFLESLRDEPVDVYLVVSRWGRSVLEQETGRTLEDVRGLVKKVFEDAQLDAPISSGSVHYEAVVILPCSMNTLARIAHGFTDTLIARCAHVALKEGRKLVVCIRETPLSALNLENALRVAQAGGIVMPMTLSMYLGQDLDGLLRAYALRIQSVLGWAAPDLWRPEEMD
jgi:4-hydroxy-3-polyprenylbenzoate decarboxylase